MRELYTKLLARTKDGEPRPSIYAEMKQYAWRSVIRLAANLYWGFLAGSYQAFAQVWLKVQVERDLNEKPREETGPRLDFDKWSLALDQYATGAAALG